MKLEYSILEHLSNNDNGKFIDVTFVHEDYDALRSSLNELKGKNLIVVEENSGRDFEAFGIGNNRKRAIKAKIKMNGRVYLHSLKHKRSGTSKNNGSSSRWSLSYFLSF